MSYPGGNGWPEQPQQPQPYQQGYQQPYQQGGLYQPYEQYQQYGGYPGGPQPPAPKKGKTALWIAIGAVVLVIAVGVTLLIVLTDKDKQLAVPSVSATPPSTPSRPTSTAPPSTHPDNKIESTTPGWQGILSEKDNAAYDLPPDGWDTKPGIISGYPEGPVQVVMHETSTYKRHACPEIESSSRGQVGFVTVDNLEVPVAARGAVRVWAQAGGSGADGKVPDVPLPETTQIPIDGGKTQATSATATFTPPASERCRAPSVQVTSAAFKSGTKTVCFLIVTDQQVPDALPAEDAKKILASLRPRQP